MASNDSQYYDSSSNDHPLISATEKKTKFKVAGKTH